MQHAPQLDGEVAALRAAPRAGAQVQAVGARLVRQRGGGALVGLPLAQHADLRFGERGERAGCAQLLLPGQVGLLLRAGCPARLQGRLPATRLACMYSRSCAVSPGDEARCAAWRRFGIRALSSSLSGTSMPASDTARIARGGAGLCTNRVGGSAGSTA